jgi:hypothetical protein
VQELKIHCTDILVLFRRFVTTLLCAPTRIRSIALRQSSSEPQQALPLDAV